MKRTFSLFLLITATAVGAAHARGFGGAIAGAAGPPVGNGIMGTGGLWGDSIAGAGGMWADGAYGNGAIFMPGMGDAYGGFFSGPPQDNLASKAPAHYNPLGGEQAISVPNPQQAEQQRVQSFNSSL